MSASARFPDLPTHWHEGTFKVLDNRYHIRLWKDQNHTGGRVLVIVHGFGENSNRYRHFPHYLNHQFDTIVAIDLYGHGLSTGARGDSQDFSNFTDDVINGINEALTGVVGELHWLGHSFGGLITLCLLKSGHLKKFKSVAVSAPFLALAMIPPAAKVFFGRLLEPVLGHLSLRNEIDLRVLSHETSVIAAYAADPLNHDRITPRTFVGMTRAQTEIIGWHGPIQQPFLCMIPLADPLVDARTSLRFFNQLKVEGSGQKNLQTFAGFFHESFNETHKGLAFNAYSNFIESLPK